MQRGSSSSREQPWLKRSKNSKWKKSARKPKRPQLLRVPTATALVYHAVWAVALAAKIWFGYYALVGPLVDPLTMLNAADYRCWTPWSPNSATANPSCAYVLDGGAAGGGGGGGAVTLSDVRGACLKAIVISLRAAVPCMMYFIDTYLWFSWTIGVASTILGWWMGLGRVSSWSALVGSFAESCQLFNEKLLANVTPHGDALAREKLHLLSTAELAPDAMRALFTPSPGGEAALDSLGRFVLDALVTKAESGDFHWERFQEAPPRMRDEGARFSLNEGLTAARKAELAEKERRQAGAG